MFWKKIYKKYESVILYALYGVPTTLISFGGYAVLMDLFHCNAAASSFLSWVAAMLVSFCLYRRYVFKSPDAPWPQKLRELAKFAGLRAGTGMFETGFVWLFVNYLGLQPYLFKVLASLFSVLVNYLLSLCIFRGEETQPAESSAG